MEFIEQGLLNKIRSAGDWCTYMDVIRFLEELGIKTGGEHIICDQGNVVYWANLSAESAELLIALFNDKKLYRYPVEKSVYDAADAGLILPLAKDLVPCGGYKSPHWLPVMLSTAPLLAPVECARRQIDHAKKYLEE